METPFTYDRYVTGKNFVGRKKECGILGNLLEAGEHVVIYEPPKSGKMSLIQQTLMNMRSSGKQFMIVSIDMFNVRRLDDFLLKYGTAVMKAAPWLAFAYTLLNPASTADNDLDVLFNEQTGQLTTAGWDDFRMAMEEINQGGKMAGMIP